MSRQTNKDLLIHHDEGRLMRQVTMTDVAREAGVSLSLVSIALRNAYGVSEETKQRIIATAQRMNYQPNALAARLASKVDNTIGVYLLDLHNEFFADVFDGMREAATAAGRELVVTIGSVSGSLDKIALDSLVRARVRTVVAAGLLLPDVDVEAYRSRLHLVSAARFIPGFDCVESDNERGAELATRHLIELGHKRITHFASPLTDGYGGRRLGYSRTMDAVGLTPHIITGVYSRQKAAEAIGPLLGSSNRPTAIFAHNDQSALGVLDALHSRGLRAPEDLSIIGYDNTSASRPPGVELTTIDLDAAHIGRRAIEIALSPRTDGAEPARETFEPTLMIRSSTGRVA